MSLNSLKFRSTSLSIAQSDDGSLRLVATSHAKPWVQVEFTLEPFLELSFDFDDDGTLTAQGDHVELSTVVDVHINGRVRKIDGGSHIVRVLDLDDCGRPRISSNDTN